MPFDTQGGLKYVEIALEAMEALDAPANDKEENIRAERKNDIPAAVTLRWTTLDGGSDSPRSENPFARSLVDAIQHRMAQPPKFVPGYGSLRAFSHPTPITRAGEMLLRPAALLRGSPRLTIPA